MKKVVNSVLASALALSVAPMVVGAEEAATAPKMDASLEKVVKRLNALGLVQGRSNGDYAVDSSITRAEFATLVVRARGLESGVNLAANTQKFADVKTADWFSGYVNVAAGQELIKGYPQNTFAPAKNVTYAEAAAMIVRSLGYEPAVKGAWPNNYISKAAELGVSAGVKVDPNKPATRGDIFEMLDNSLSIDLLEQVSYGTDTVYKANPEKNLLSEYLDVDLFDMDWSDDEDAALPKVIETPITDLGTLKPNEVTLYGKNGAPNGKYVVADGINVNDFVGQEVQVWVKDGREDVIVWMEGSDDEEVVQSSLGIFYQNGVIPADDSKIDWNAKDALSNFQLELGNGIKYDFADNVKVAYNFNVFSNAIDGLKEIGLSDADILAKSTKVVLNDDGDISYISVIDNVTADKSTSDKYKFGSEVIEKVDAEKKKIYTLDGNDIDLKDDEEGSDFIVYRNGQPAKLADLKAMDVYSIYYSDGDKDKKIIFANSTVVTGKVVSVDYKKANSGNSADYYIKIDDKKYRLRAATYSEDANKTVENNAFDKIKDLTGVEVKLYLDPSGRVRHVETSTAVKDRRVDAILTKDVFYDEGKDTYSFQVQNEKGTEVTLEVKDSDDIKDKDGKKIPEDQIVNSFKVGTNNTDKKIVALTYEFDSTGAVKEVRLEDTSKLIEIAKTAWDKAADEDDNVVTYQGEDYKVADDAVVYDMTGNIEKVGSRYELKDAETTKFASIADEDFHVFMHTDSDGEVDYFYVLDGDKSLASEGLYGLVTMLSTEDGDDFAYVLGKDGKETKYKLDGTPNFNRFDFIYFELTSDNELDNTEVIVDSAGDTPEDAAIAVTTAAELDAVGLDKAVVARVDDIDGDTISYDATFDPKTGTDSNKNDVEKNYYTQANAGYFNMEYLSTETGVEEGDYVVLIDTDDDGSKMDYVFIVAKESDVEDYDYTAGYDMSKFLNVTITTPEPVVDLVKNATAKFDGLLITSFSADVDATVTKVEIFDGATKLADAKVASNKATADLLSVAKGKVLTVKAYVGTELKETESVTVE